MRFSYGVIVVGLLAAVLTGGCGEATSADQPTRDRVVQACPFDFPAPEALFPAENTPVLLTFPIFSLDDHLDVLGANGRGFQLMVFSAHPFDQDGRLNTSATIGYLQTMRGGSVLLLPEEVSAEFDRIDNNSIAMFEAETRMELIEVGGLEIQAHVAVSDASMIATLMLPINGGEVFHPVSIGVYPGMAGCEETMRVTFDRVIANLSLNLENPHYLGAESIQDILAEKRGLR